MPQSECPAYRSRQKKLSTLFSVTPFLVVPAILNCVIRARRSCATRCVCGMTRTALPRCRGCVAACVGRRTLCCSSPEASSRARSAASSVRRVLLMAYFCPLRPAGALATDTGFLSCARNLLRRNSLRHLKHVFFAGSYRKGEADHSHPRPRCACQRHHRRNRHASGVGSRRRPVGR